MVQEVIEYISSKLGIIKLQNTQQAIRCDFDVYS